MVLASLQKRVDMGGVQGSGDGDGGHTLWHSTVPENARAVATAIITQQVRR